MASTSSTSRLHAAAAHGAVSVVHVVDALNIGGAERVAVNLVNLLPRDRYVPYLCTTRSEGPLSQFVSPHVTRLCLERRGKFDTAALRLFVRFVEERRISVVHAHASALFFSRIAAAVSGKCALVWHDHYGRADFGDRSAWLYRVATRGIDGVIAVNQTLADWCRARLHVPQDRVWYIPNLVESSEPDGAAAPLDLAGEPGMRIACVANFRPQKDHPNLLRAMVRVRSHVPGAHLFLIGDSAEPAYVAQIRAQITELNLDGVVTYMGPRNDVPSILRQCSIGVLSSASEGLPLALLEYGKHGLAAVSTAVGQCPEVLDHGQAGVLVPAGLSENLSHALIGLLQDPNRRAHYAREFQERVEEQYSARTILGRICRVYDRVLEGR
jgi:glycosyltransferase involved in cell wall biosynthesis